MTDVGALTDEAQWVAVWHCEHAAVAEGPLFPLGLGTRAGTFRIVVCRSCGSFRVEDHLGGRRSDWHPSAFLSAAKRGDRTLLQEVV